jgi:hypothetical protein
LRLLNVGNLYRNQNQQSGNLYLIGNWKLILPNLISGSFRHRAMQCIHVHV